MPLGYPLHINIMQPSQFTMVHNDEFTRLHGNDMNNCKKTRKGLSVKMVVDESHLIQQ